MGLSVAALSAVLAGKGGSVMMAAKAAYLARVPVETILYGTVMSTDKCPTCGQKVPET